MIARYDQTAANPATLVHQLGITSTEACDIPTLLRAARHLGLKARHSPSAPERLAMAPLPALAKLRSSDGELRVVILAQGDGLRVLLQDSSAPATRPTIEALDHFAARWSGELILIASQASMAGALARFDFSWFIPSLVKYRRLSGEIIGISVMLQLFALVSPLFFQVVDKVLVQRPDQP